MEERLRKELLLFKKSTISLSELEDLLGSDVKSYEEFALTVLKLEEEGILTMVKAKGRTGRSPAVALQYRINRAMLGASHSLELRKQRSILHPAINLDLYYSLDPAIFAKDLPYIQKVDEYIKKGSLPEEEVPAPERSFELVGDEKWIVDQGGKALLERIGLWGAMKVIPVSDPLMFAVNPLRIGAEDQFHLIVENKTTYQGLLPAIQDTKFSTLIYGCGKAVIKSIEQFEKQYPVRANHYFVYFGDLDREGVSIWHSLSKRERVVLALPFYKACMQEKSVPGKAYQRDREEALHHFLSFFNEEEQHEISEMFLRGEYYPQEVLKTKVLQQIWREADWKALICLR